jgi:hypothetical protein
VISVERLNPDDQVMLWPDQLWPQEIGAVIWLDGRGLFDDEGRFRIDAVRQMIEGRLHEVPRLRQILYSPRRGLGGPLWVDAPRFDLRDHVRVVPLCGPAAEPAILAEVERLRRQRLDRSRPLWLMSFPDRTAGRSSRSLREDSSRDRRWHRRDRDGERLPRHRP